MNETVQILWELRWVLGFTTVVTAGALWAESRTRGDVQVPAQRDGADQ